MKSNVTPRLLSIGLPVYNGEKYLQRALNSILAQDYDDIEFVISDNASSDATPDICREFAARDHRVRWERQTENKGACWNFNRVFQRAHGEFFMWAAHDDIWAASFASECIAVLEADPTVAIAHAVSVAQKADGTVVSRLQGRLYENLSHSPRERWGQALKHWELHSAICGVMRRELALQTRGMLPVLSADLIFGRNVAARSGAPGAARADLEIF